MSGVIRPGRHFPERWPRASYTKTYRVCKCRTLYNMSRGDKPRHVCFLAQVCFIPHVHVSFPRCMCIPQVCFISQVYNTDSQTPDSAGTATAFLTGEKSRRGTLGVDQTVPRGNCSSSLGHSMKSILKYSHEAGKEHTLNP